MRNYREGYVNGRRRPGGRVRRLLFVGRDKRNRQRVPFQFEGFVFDDEGGVPGRLDGVVVLVPKPIFAGVIAEREFNFVRVGFPVGGPNEFRGPIDRV